MKTAEFHYWLLLSFAD